MIKKPEAVMFGGDWYDVIDKFSYGEEKVYRDGGTLSIGIIIFEGVWQDRPRMYHVDIEHVQAFRYLVDGE